jgi:hypothetical protein
MAMSFEFLKEVVAFLSALISFVSALSSAKLIQRSHYSVDPLKWGALCFALGSAFAAALFLGVSKQTVYPLDTEPVVQWGGLLGFLGAVLGLISVVFIKKEVSQAQANAELSRQLSDDFRSRNEPVPQVVYVQQPPPAFVTVIDWEPIIIFGMLFGTISFGALLLFLHGSRL